MRTSDGVRMWLDDIRDPAMYGRIGWSWVKTADEAIALLASGVVIECSLDHDLDIQATLGNPPTEKTGYDVVCWMEANNVYPRDGVHVHSLNPSGGARMKQALRAIRERTLATPESKFGASDTTGKGE
jgi:hypothetical protein